MHLNGSVRIFGADASILRSHAAFPDTTRSQGIGIIVALLKTVTGKGTGLLFFAVLVLLFPIASSAQLLDSIRLFMKAEPRIVVKLDSRGSFITNEPITMYGVKVGWEHAKRFQYGFGYHVLLRHVRRERQFQDAAGLYSTTTRMRMGYFAPYAEYAFFQRGHWEVRIPVQIGIGHGSVVYDDRSGEKRTWQRSWLFLYEPGMTVQYRFLKYFAVHAGFGYRLVFRTSAGLGEQLTAPIYMAGLRLFTSDIWKDLND